MAGERLTRSFTLDELTRSDTAERHGLNNTPGPVELRNLRDLAENVLQPIRDLLNCPLHISSGYRCPALNRLVNGSEWSQHMRGSAADFVTSEFSPKEVIARVRNSEIPFDQLIEEFGRWVHVSWSPAPRGQVLLARRGPGGRIEYVPAG